MRKIILFILVILCSVIISAQVKSPAKFGKISANDFQTTVYRIDSNAAAVIIADIGTTKVVGNEKGWFSLEFIHFKRIHILKQSGYDVANVEIPLYANGSAEEQLQNLKAYTYNLENGNVIETKLDIKNSVFKDRINKNLVVKKFTFPAIKEGSIIEFEHTVTSDFLFNLQPWEFQGSYPRLWSEYIVSLPEFLNYVFLSQGLQYDFVKEQKSRQQAFHVTDSRVSVSSDQYKFSANVTDYRFIMKNVPSLKEENYTSTIANHIAKIEFQLAEIRSPLSYKQVMSSWEEVCKNLLKDEDFGLQLSKDNSWLDEEFGTVTRGKDQSMGKAISIYKYFQKNFTCTSYDRKYIDQPLKNILKEKKGSVAEINLLLVAMFRKAGLVAEPVMLSTKSHGYTYSIYPIMSKFNYVICRTVIDNKEYYLDASRPRLGFGKLSWDCYNGHARIINEQATPVELLSDSLFEKKVTSLFFANEENGEIKGSMHMMPGYYESFSLRNRVKEKGMEEIVKDIKQDFGAEMQIINPKIDLLDKLEEGVQILFDLKLNLEREDNIYLNPMFGEGYKENPFKSAERTYPVEMPYAMEETYALRIEVPENFQVDELPKSIRAFFDEEKTSYFEYLITESEGVISLRSKIKLVRSYFMPDEYDILRNFFALIVSKHAEEIVFKKKK